MADTIDPVAAAELRSASAAIALALCLLEPHRELFARFEKEALLLESVGFITHPTLMRAHLFEPWRADVRAIYKLAHAFLQATEETRDRLKEHLDEAQAHGR